MQKQYKNREWLYNQYWNNKLSPIKIGRLCGSYMTIRRWLKKLDIPRRPCGECQHLGKTYHCDLFQEAIQWINGELLGDGHLYSKSVYSAGFSYTSKYLEYAQYVSDTLKLFGIEQIGNINKRINKKWNNHSYQYTSHSYPELLFLHRQWYPKGKKVIPKNIRLTPITLRQHHIGDGMLRHQKYGKPHIILSTNGFDIDDVKWLIRKLIKIGFRATRQIHNNSIYISSYSTKDFLNYIGKCPVRCYQYKFEY